MTSSATQAATAVDPGFIARMASLTREDLSAAFTFPAMVMLVATILGFMVPALIIWPPVPIRISEALNQTHTKLGDDDWKQDKEADKTTKKKKKKAEEKEKEKRRGDSRPTIEELVTYPVKSCGGISVRKSKVLPAGLEFDRLYAFGVLQAGKGRKMSPPPADMVVVEKRGTGRTEEDGVWDVLTQRQCPRLAALKVDLWVPDAYKIRRKVKLDERIPSEAWIIIRFPYTPPGIFRGAASWLAAKIGKGWRGIPETEILLPVKLKDMDEFNYRSASVKIWKDVVAALDVSRELPRELRAYLGIEPGKRLGIFRLGVKAEREVYRAAPRKEEAGYQPVVGFADAVSFTPDSTNCTPLRDDSMLTVESILSIS
jgi:hypothetical protein